jgi:hypothetical protein
MPQILQETPQMQQTLQLEHQTRLQILQQGMLLVRLPTAPQQVQSLLLLPEGKSLHQQLLTLQLQRIQQLLRLLLTLRMMSQSALAMQLQ